MRVFSRRPSASFSAAVAGGLLVLVAAPDAAADLFGGDLPLLGTLVSQGVQQLSTASQALHALNEDVTSAQRMVGFATQAHNLFSHFASTRVADFGADTFGLAQGTPPVSDAARLTSGVATWAPATGELQAVAPQCANDASSGSSACRQMHDAVTPADAKTALSSTFGPALHSDTRASDYEVARALSAADTHQQQESSRAAVSAASRDAACASGGDASVCGLAQTARQESQLDTVNQQLAEANRLQATHLALQNAERKRALGEALERRAAVTEGLKALRTARLVVSGDGVSFLGAH
ncbi:MAG: hypothetical protein ACLQDQ_12775 [Myxococcaceae bacterium]